MFASLVGEKQSLTVFLIYIFLIMVVEEYLFMYLMT